MKAIRKTATEDVRITMDYDDRVTASSWSVPAGLTGSRADYSGKQTEIIIDGGTLDTTYQVTNTATLDTNESLERSILVMVVTR